MGGGRDPRDPECCTATSCTPCVWERMQPHICSQLGSCGWSVNDFTAFHLAPYSLRSAAGLLHRECKVLLVPSCECRTLVLNMVQDMGTVCYAVSRMPQDIVHLAIFVTFCG